MKYAFNKFTLTDNDPVYVQGQDSLFTYQNTGTSEALIQGSNDAVAWIDITLISAGASVIKTHSYSFLRMSGSTQVLVSRGEVNSSSTGDGFVVRDTYLNIVTNYPPADYVGKQAFATDLGSQGRGAPVVSNGLNWRRLFSQADFVGTLKHLIIGGLGATYSQTGTTVTVTWTSHGLSAYEFNGASVYLVQNTGSLLSGWFTDFTYVDANTFTVTSAISQSTSGNLGTNTDATDIPVSFTFPATTGFVEVGDLLSFTGLIRNKSSIFSKTAKLYFGTNLVATSTQTTSNNWMNVSSPSIMSLGAGNYILIRDIQITPINTTAKATIQLSSSTDWAAFIFNRATVATSS